LKKKEDCRVVGLEDDLYHVVMRLRDVEEEKAPKVTARNIHFFHSQTSNIMIEVIFGGLFESLLQNSMDASVTKIIQLNAAPQPVRDVL